MFPRERFEAVRESQEYNGVYYGEEGLSDLDVLERGVSHLFDEIPDLDQLDVVDWECADNGMGAEYEVSFAYAFELFALELEYHRSDESYWEARLVADDGNIIEDKTLWTNQQVDSYLNDLLVNGYQPALF